MNDGKISRPPPPGWWKWPVGILLGIVAIGAFNRTMAPDADDKPDSGSDYAAMINERNGAEPAAEAKPANGEHCLSGWDGANRDLVRQVKASMREPDSFEHVETRIYGNDNGEHGLWMTFRARNGFGGMNVEKVYARIDHESCKALRFGDGPGI